MHAIADNVFTALADPTRRGILERLTRDGEQTVHALTDRAGVSQPERVIAGWLGAHRTFFDVGAKLRTRRF